MRRWISFVRARARRRIRRGTVIAIVGSMLLLVARVAFAGVADVVDVKVQRESGGTFHFDVTVRHADGTDHEKEIFVREFPWSRVPPTEDGYTPVADLLARYAEWHAANTL